MKIPEILSPCGGAESVTAALRTGADAVYLGAQKFSARHNAVNFTDDELKEAVRECHRHGVLVYLAFNTVIRDEELPEAAELLRLACDIGIDGLIIQDLAVYEMAKTACPGMPLHASTQMTVHTPKGVDAAKKLGFSRVVAARELSSEEIRALCGRGVEIEAFAHGALCMCVSGQCYLSAMIGGRSANRGLCAGACRLPFSAKGVPHDDYALSLKDMSYSEYVKELSEAGVCSLKIEGRMKRPEYVAAATNSLKCARDGEEYDREALRAVFSRNGFTDGYITGRLGADMFGARSKEDVTAAGDALPKLRKLYEKPEKRFTFDMAFEAIAGEPISLKVSDGEYEAEVFGDIPEAAISRETTEEAVRTQLTKLGGTLYEPGAVKVTLGGGLAIPLSKINELRRLAVEAIDEKRIAALSSPKSFDGSGLQFFFPLPLIRKRPRLRIRIERVEQLSKAELYDDEKIIIPLGLEEDYISAGYSPERAVIALPRFDTNEEKTAERLNFAKSLGFGVVECGNIGHIELARELGFTAQGGFGLNITNALAARHYFFEGLETLTLSPELKAHQLSCIACPGKLGAIIYGRLPLMLTRNCPIAAQVGCKNCTGKLTDRTGAEFPVLCRREKGYYELLNSKVLWLADKLDDFNLDFGDIAFTVETPEQAAEVIKRYRTGLEPKGEFTRGLYYRGVE